MMGPAFSRIPARWAQGRRERIGLGIGVASICGLLVALPAGAQTAPQPSHTPQTVAPPQDPADQLTPQQEEDLHTGVLEIRQLERGGDRPGAIRSAEKLLQRFTGNRRVEDILVNLYRLEHRDGDLIELLRRRTKRDPQDADAVRELASVLIARGTPDDAMETLKRFIAANPHDEARYRIAAGLFASRGQFDPAIGFYRQGRQAIGVENLFAPELAQMERQRGNIEAALGEYLLLAEDPERRGRMQREIESLIDDADNRDVLVARIDQMRQKHPKSVAIHDIAATTYLSLGKLPQALDAIRQADAQAGDQGEHLLDFGRRALAKAPGGTVDPERAHAGVEALQLVGQRHPASNLIPEAARLVAEGLVGVARDMPDGEPRLTMLRDAVRAIDMSLGRLNGPDLENDALALKGMIQLQDLGQPKEALTTFEALAKRQRDLDQSDALVRVQEALCHAALGDLPGARAVLQEIVRADSLSAIPAFAGGRRPQQPADIGWSRARFHLAELDMIAGQYDQARDGFAALAEQAPEDRLSNDCLDMALLLNEVAGSDDAALKIYGATRQARLLRDRKSLHAELESIVRDHAQSPLAPIALFELALELTDEHDTAGAITRYAELVTQHHEHRLAARALENTGDLQMQVLHQTDLAVGSYEQLLTDYPDDLFLDGVRKKLLAARAAKGENHATP
jgi:tetratricopeptide (TPR) repeat protein